MAKLQIATLVVSAKFRDIADDEQEQIIGGDGPSLEAIQMVSSNGSIIQYAFLGLDVRDTLLVQRGFR